MKFTRRVQEEREHKPEDARAAQGLCHAFGCPLRGAISPNTHEGGPWFCRFHFNTESHTWGETTRKIRVGGLQDAKAPTVNVTMTPEEAKAYIKSRLGRPSFSPPSKEWARVLKVREEAGEKLLPVQREMWRAALGEGNTSSRAELNEAEAELAAERAAIQAEG